MSHGVLNYAAPQIKRDHSTVTYSAVQISQKGESEKYKRYSTMVFNISTSILISLKS